MIRQRIRITGLVVTLAAVAAMAPCAIALPVRDAGGLATQSAASTVVQANPDQQSPSGRATRVQPNVQANPDQQSPSGRASRVEPNVPATPMPRVSLDPQTPSSHATPSAAAPTGGGFDWTALGIGIGAVCLLGLCAVAFRSAARRSGHPAASA